MIHGCGNYIKLHDRDFIITVKHVLPDKQNYHNITIISKKECYLSHLDIYLHPNELIDLALIEIEKPAKKCQMTPATISRKKSHYLLNLSGISMSGYGITSIYGKVIETKYPTAITTT